MKRVMKKLATLAIVAGFVATAFGTFGINGKAAGVFAGGTGTQADPYVVENVDQLKAVKDYNGCYFVQSKNINVGFRKLSSVFGDAPFTGHYDGKGHKISNGIASGNNACVIANIGKGGSFSNVNFNKFVISGHDSAALVNTNDGTISNVQMGNCQIKATRKNDGESKATLFCVYNGENGTIDACKAKKNSVTIKANSWLGEADGAGICIDNDGQILNTKVTNLQLKVKSVQFWAKGAGLVLNNNCSVVRCSVSIKGTATSFGDKSGKYGAPEPGTMAKTIGSNKGISSGCKAKGKFKADKKVRK